MTKPGAMCSLPEPGRGNSVMFVYHVLRLAASSTVQCWRNPADRSCRHARAGHNGGSGCYPPSAEACSSHITSFVSSELLKTSHGAASFLSIRQRKSSSAVARLHVLIQLRQYGA